MKLFSGILTILFALLISATAAWFSVAGLVALFAATAIPVMIMGIVLESSKLVAAGWLHANWKNKNVNLIHKLYLTTAVLALMLITSIGIYGFLSKGHLEQAAPLAGVELQVNAKQQQIQMLTDNNNRLTTQLKQLDASVDALMANNKTTQSLRVRSSQGKERASIQKQMNDNNAQIQKLNADILPLKQQTVEVEAKLGPVKYVAQLFGWQDTDKAVRLVILVIMFAFDPLAVILLISATISFGEWAEERKAKVNAAFDALATKPSDLQTNEEMRVVSPSMAYAPGYKGDERGMPVKIDEVADEAISQVAQPEVVVMQQNNLQPQADLHGRIEPVFTAPAPVVDEQEPTFVQEEVAKEQESDEEILAVLREADVIAPEVTVDTNNAAQTAPEAQQEAGTNDSTPSTQRAPNDNQRVIEILESRPEFLQQLIDVIGEHIKQSDEVKDEVAKVDEPQKPGHTPWLK
jgi:hypothetical protein